MSQKSSSSADTEVPTPGEFDWAVVNSLLQAQSHTNESLERYLLYVTHDEFDIPDEQLESCLTQAITSHQRALEDLKTARQFLKECDQ